MRLFGCLARSFEASRVGGGRLAHLAGAGCAKGRPSQHPRGVLEQWGWVLYRLRPLAGLVRWLLWALALLGDIRTLRGLDVLVVAYLRCCWSDSLSFDAAVARRLGCKVYTVTNQIVTVCYIPHLTPVESPPHYGLHGLLGMAKGPSYGSGNPRSSSIGELLFALSRPLNPHLMSMTGSTLPRHLDWTKRLIWKSVWSQVPDLPCCV